MSSFLKRAVSALVIAVAVLSSTAACTGSTDDAREPVEHPVTVTSSAASRVLVAPDTDTFDTDDGPATLACQGFGPVPVILVAGTDDPITRWDVLVDDLGQHILACRFAPASGDDVEPATPARRADALSQVLNASGLPGPYVLVAHSLGGLTVRRFGDRHPDQLGAALFLDATTPVALLSLHAELTADGWDAEATQADAGAPASWPSVPLTVLAHDPAGQPLGLGPDIEALWTEGQRTYTSLTDDARFEEVEGAGHAIDLDATSHVSREVLILIGATT